MKSVKNIKVKAGSKNTKKKSSSSSSKSQSMVPAHIESFYDDINRIALNESIKRGEEDSGIKFSDNDKKTMKEIIDGKSLVEVTIPHFEYKIGDYNEKLRKVDKNLELLGKMLKLKNKLLSHQIEKLNDLNNQCIELIENEKKENISENIDLKSLEGHSQIEKFEDLYEEYTKKYLELIGKLNNFIKIYQQHSQAINEGYSSNEHKLEVESEIADKNARDLIESLNLEESKKKTKSKTKKKRGGSKKSLSSSSSKKQTSSSLSEVLKTIEDINLEERIKEAEEKQGHKFSEKDIARINEINSDPEKGSQLLIEDNINFMSNSIESYIELQKKIKEFHLYLLNITQKQTKLKKKLTNHIIEKKTELDKIIETMQDQHTTIVKSLNLESKFIKESPKRVEFEELFENFIQTFNKLINEFNEFKKLYNLHIESIIEGYSSNEYKLQVESEIAEKNARELIESLNLEEKPKKSKKKGK